MGCKCKDVKNQQAVCVLTSEWPGSLAPNPRTGNCLSLEHCIGGKVLKQKQIDRLSFICDNNTNNYLYPLSPICANMHVLTCIINIISIIISIIICVLHPPFVLTCLVLLTCHNPE